MTLIITNPSLRISKNVKICLCKNYKMVKITTHILPQHVFVNFLFILLRYLICLREIFLQNKNTSFIYLCCICIFCTLEGRWWNVLILFYTFYSMTSDLRLLAKNSGIGSMDILNKSEVMWCDVISFHFISDLI